MLIIMISSPWLAEMNIMLIHLNTIGYSCIIIIIVTLIIIVVIICYNS